MPELDWSGNEKYVKFKADWKTPETLLEGSLNSAKTTLGLDKEIDALLRWPGIPILLFRWTEDAVTTKLKPAFDELLSIRGVHAEWDAKLKVYALDNGSRAWMFGLKAVSAIEMYNKIRGLGVCRIMGDQVEEMDRGVAGELRGRLRPNLTATLAGRSFPFQLTFIANPEDHDFWLSKEFPLDNHIKGRQVISLSVFDNYHAPKESIASLLRQYPEDHPKNQTMIQGMRGPNIVGDPVFEGLYQKELHWRAVSISNQTPVLESFEFGKHNPTWVFAQEITSGGIAVLGGIRGEGLALEDFLTQVSDYRKKWFPDHVRVKSCVAPMGEKQDSWGERYTPLVLIQKHVGTLPLWQDNGNAPDVRLAMIETISSYLRRRNMNRVESFAINNDEDWFLIINKDGSRKSAFMHHAFEAGAVWDKHFVSVASKEVRHVREDDKFSNALHCLENIVLNFYAGRRKEPTPPQHLNQPVSSRHWMGV